MRSIAITNTPLALKAMLCHGKVVPPKLSLVSRVPDESTPQPSKGVLPSGALRMPLGLRAML